MLLIRPLVLIGGAIATGLGVTVSAPAQAADVSPALVTSVGTASTANDLIIGPNGTTLIAVTREGVMTTYSITGPVPVESATLQVGKNIANSYFTSGPTVGHVYILGQQAAPKAGTFSFLFDIDPVSNSVVSSTLLGGGAATGVVVADITDRYILAPTEAEEMLVFDRGAKQVTGAIRAGNGPLITRALDSSNRLYVSNGSPEISVVTASPGNRTCSTSSLACTVEK